MNCITLCFKTADKQEICQKYYSEFEVLVRHLGDKKFFFGNKETIVDILFFEKCMYMEKVSDGKYEEQFPTLPAYVERVRNLPGLKEFYNSDRCIKNVWGTPSMQYKWD